MKIKTSIIIPTWNGKNLLQKNLLKVINAVSKDTEIIIVENGSTDGSVEWLKKLKVKNEEVIIIFNKDNLGFIGGCNQGVKKARGEFVALINNDVVPEKDFLKSALKHFNDKNVFAVSLNEINNQWQSSYSKILWHSGYFNYLAGEQIKKSHISGWASGGSAIFRKSMWQELGGLDEVFAPFYWEDTDLSYRAWQSGWKILWEPNSKVEHNHESTISRFDKNYVDIIKERNQLLFIWKNIRDSELLISHFFGIVFRVLSGPNYIKVVFKALKRYLDYKNKLLKTKNIKRTDMEIFDLFK